MLEVSHIHASYGEIKALWDVDLLVPEGGIVSVLGPNGAGNPVVTVGVGVVVTLIVGVGVALPIYDVPLHDNCVLDSVTI